MYFHSGIVKTLLNDSLLIVHSCWISLVIQVKNLNIWSKTHFKTLNNFSITLYFRPKNRANELYPDLASPNLVFFQKWCIFLFSILMIKLHVRVLRLMKMHDYLDVPPCVICTPCNIWYRHGTSGIFGLWAFRKYILLCLSNVHDKEYAPLKQNRCISLYFGVTCSQLLP